MKKIVLALAVVATLAFVSCTADEPITNQSDTTNQTLRLNDSTGGQLGDPNNPRPKP
ncbi:MAG: hypothetical protein ACK5RV_02930 [Flavobacterium sp.]|jgi:uncharacterized protein YcfL|uniref:hypothetical protein n=1 Tax=Flavobacterium sp. TaxID=239 RepID=UPI0022BBFB7C|nr:hypothetical protein [Flavobacterium sp.]MCZ8169287.1 hypothetical protein [Flavobacterium sp.]MCZ8297891.1 hypothetical protein [Flavobacterium sp.]